LVNLDQVSWSKLVSATKNPQEQKAWDGIPGLRKEDRRGGVLVHGAAETKKHLETARHADVTIQ